MRKILALAGIAVVAAVLATPASADTRKCYTVHVGNIPTTEQCIYLPVDPSPTS